MRFEPLVRIVGTVALALLACGLLCNASWGQTCGAGWLDSGLTGKVNATANWDIDGSGPQPAGIVAGGLFSVNSSTAANIAYWNTSRWVPVGGGVKHSSAIPVVNAVLVMPNGDLIVGGFFESVVNTDGSVLFVNNIARWNRASSIWARLGSAQDNGVVGRVNALAQRNGVVYVAGNFSQSGGATLTPGFVAQWNGTSWSALGGGGTPPDSEVESIIVYPGGDVIVGLEGNFDVLRWGPNTSNVVEWSNISVGDFLDEVVAFGILPNGPGGTTSPDGDLIAVGDFANTDPNTQVLDMSGIARGKWNSTHTAVTWVSLDLGLRNATGGPFGDDDFGLAIAVLPNNDFLVGGHFTLAGTVNGGTDAFKIARWKWDATPTATSNSGHWEALRADHALDSGVDDHGVFAITVMPNGDVVAGGNFNSAGGFGASGVHPSAGPIVRFTTLPGMSEPSWASMSTRSFSQWVDFPPGSTSTSNIRALAVTNDMRGSSFNKLVVGGDFSAPAGVSANQVALFDGNLWTPMGLGFSDRVNALVVQPVSGHSGSIYAGGEFTNTGSTTLNHIARYDDENNVWVALSGGLNGSVNAMAVWSGMLVVGGDFTAADNGGTSVAASGLAMWDGTEWAPITDGNGLPMGVSGGSVKCLAVNKDGGLIVGGSINTVFQGALSGDPADPPIVTTVAGIAGWKSNSWKDFNGGITSGSVNAILSLNITGGKLIVGGSFGASGTSWGDNIAVWTGTTSTAGSWSALGGSSAISGVDGPVRAIARKSDTEYYFGGSFLMASRAGFSSVATTNIALWAGSSWYQLGGDNNAMETMVTGYPTSVNALAVMPSGDLEVGADGTTFQPNATRASAFATWSHSGVPWVAIQPPIGQSMSSGCPHTDDTITIPAHAALGFEFQAPLTYVWKHNTITVVDGLHGTNGSSGTTGGTVSGATTDTLSITGYNSGDVGGYTLTVTNSCGSSTSSLATLGLGCAADFNGDCTLAVQDIFDFLTAWFLGCTGQTSSPCLGRNADFNHQNGLQVQDIFDYLAAWFAGC